MADSYFAWLDKASPSEQLNHLISGGWIAQAIGVAAELGIADLLADGPKPSDELAQATGSHPKALYRMLRALASVGIFSESEPRQFVLTPMAEMLRSDAPRSLRGRVSFTTSDVQRRAWGELRHSVKTGNTAFEFVHGMNVWEYRAKHPAAGAAFNAAMTSLSLQVAGAVVEAYDFGGQKVVVDVAGGHGALLMSILRANGRLRGTVFDLPHVVEGTAQAIEAADLGIDAPLWPGTCSSRCRPEPTCISFPISCMTGTMNAPQRSSPAAARRCGQTASCCCWSTWYCRAMHRHTESSWISICWSRRADRSAPRRSTRRSARRPGSGSRG
jgi:O-methyltransferase/methyltransferase family protein